MPVNELDTIIRSALERFAEHGLQGRKWTEVMGFAKCGRHRSPNIAAMIGLSWYHVPNDARRKPGASQIGIVHYHV